MDQYYRLSLMSRPQFPISTKSPYLRLVKAEVSACAASDELKTPLVRGVRYSMSYLSAIMNVASQDIAEWPGVTGGYPMSTAEGCLMSTSASDDLFIWDGDARWQGMVRENEFQLLRLELHGPIVAPAINGFVLTIEPQFDVRFRTLGFAAALGEVRLVESKRFVVLEDGDTIPLLDTHEEEMAVLYQDALLENQPVQIHAPWQMRDTEAQYLWRIRATQYLPEALEGKRVVNVTVLEQYTSYFMQRPLTDVPENSIWVPVCAPVTWGWSMRVEPGEEDGWHITRRKLVLPTVGHEGWQMPVWSSNTRNCTCTTL